MANARSAGGGNGKRVNKSEAIRELLKQQPAAKSKEIVAQMARRGIRVAPTLVYYIKSKQKQQRRRQKRQRRTGRNSSSNMRFRTSLKPSR